MHARLCDLTKRCRADRSVRRYARLLRAVLRRSPTRRGGRGRSSLAGGARSGVRARANAARSGHHRSSGSAAGAAPGQFAHGVRFDAEALRRHDVHRDAAGVQRGRPDRGADVATRRPRTPIAARRSAPVRGARSAAGHARPPRQPSAGRKQTRLGPVLARRNPTLLPSFERPHKLFGPWCLARCCP